MKRNCWVSRVCALLFVASAVCVTLAPNAAASPVQWRVEDGGNGHWYQVVRVAEGIDWPGAKAMAPTILSGGYLATITSEEENWFIWNALNIGNTYTLWFVDGADNWQGPWLGGRKTAHDPNDPSKYWIWDNDEPWGFTAWATGEPNNWEGNETKLQYFWSPNNEDEMAVWNDVINHGSVKSFVVEVPEPGTLTLLALGGIGLLSARRRIHR